MTSDLLTISKNLQKYMDSKNLSLLELSEMLGEPSSTVHGWLNGIAPKNIVTLRKIAHLLGLSIEELCFNEITKSRHLDSDLTINIGGKSFKLLFKPLD